MSPNLSTRNTITTTPSPSCTCASFYHRIAPQRSIPTIYLLQSTSLYIVVVPCSVAKGKGNKSKVRIQGSSWPSRQSCQFTQCTSTRLARRPSNFRPHWQFFPPPCFALPRLPSYYSGSSAQNKGGGGRAVVGDGWHNVNRSVNSNAHISMYSPTQCLLR